jgi:hypothetical protein
MSDKIGLVRHCAAAVTKYGSTVPVLIGLGAFALLVIALTGGRVGSNITCEKNPIWLQAKGDGRRQRLWCVFTFAFIEKDTPVNQELRAES